MPDKAALDPESRVLYGDSLMAPTGYLFDAAIATTFSLDFETALAAPVSLALFAAEDREEILAQPLALLEGAERIAGRLVVFVDAGRIAAQSQPHSRLCSLLEKVIVEVAAPRDGGAFHPKIWVLRFRPHRTDEPTLMRLIVLSRNLTRDRSWDISLRLDGERTQQPRSKNRPVADLIMRLPDLEVAGITDDARSLTVELSEDVRRAIWKLPEGFDDVSFAVNGFGGRTWRPPECVRLGIISPFCDTDALNLLSKLPTADRPIFIGRSDQLACVNVETLEGFGKVSVLDEMAISEDGEEADASALQGLHAKCFVAEIGWNTVVTLGSGNATRPALISGNNVEVFASVTGKRSKVGSVEDILGSKGFGRLTRPFVAKEFEAPDPALVAAEARVDEARRALCRNALRLRCERSDDDSNEKLWRLWLTPIQPLPLTGIGTLSVWPVTRGDGHARDVLSPVRSGEPIDLGSMSMIDLTRFVAFSIADEAELTLSLFSTGLPIEGMPNERHAAILRWIINNRDTFFRYLRLLLSELGDPFGAALAAQDGSGESLWNASADDAPLLEEMVRALCNGGERLRAVDRLITRLDAGGDTGFDPVPAEFRTLWDAFRVALTEGRGPHVKQPI
jgi:hypothetical protein